MNSSNSKTDFRCEKLAKECHLDSPSLQNNISICSCSKCNSFDCFSLRNRGNCICNQGSKPKSLLESNKNITNPGQSKYSMKTVKLPETESMLGERIKEEITYENNNNNVIPVKRYSKYSYNGVPEFSKSDDNTNDDQIHNSTERLDHPFSATITYSSPNFDTNTAKLSAQIMNVPYKDFKKSISYNKYELSTPKPTKLSRYDILTRIKEAYKACSCKVCECLIGKTTNRNEFCKCKPCECSECKALIKNINGRETVKQTPVGCPCIRCDRPDCKGIVKTGQPAFCDCDPCDCLKCSDSFTKPCSCQPCECIECRSYSITKPRKNNTLVAASMREDVPRNYCQCSPCDCDNCIQGYSMASSLRHEMGTGINRPLSCSCETCVNQSCEAQDSNSCTCDVKKRLMRKPVQKDTRDYDIHRASIKNNVIGGKNKNNDMIAMFAAVGKGFPKFENNNNSCNCGDCECIVCSCKETRTLLNQKASNCLTCKCSLCECVNCDSSQQTRQEVCGCNMCDCIKCNGLSKPSTSIDKRRTNSIKFRSIIPSNACKCSPCECTNCQKMMYKCTGDSCYCTNCKCQMCTDQTKFINETVYRSKNEYVPFCTAYSNNKNGEYFINKNDGKTCLTPDSVYPDKERTIKTEPRLSRITNHDSTSNRGLSEKHVRKSTRILIANNSSEIGQKRQQIARACKTFAPCKEKDIVQSYRRAPEYESSQSFLSENSSLRISSNISNVHHNGILNAVTEQKYLGNSAFEIETPCNMTEDDSVSIQCRVERCLGDITEFGSELNLNNSYKNTLKPMQSLFATQKKWFNINYTKSNIKKPNLNAYPSIIGANHKNDMFLEVDDGSCLLNETCSKIKNVKDLSLNLATSLKNANEKLSILMKPKLSYYHPKLGHSKADISLPKNTNISREMKNSNSRINMGGIKHPFSNFCLNYTGNLSDIEIDYDKIKITLQQANAFSVELVKVLKDYKRANRVLESKSSKETPMKKYSSSLFEVNHSCITNNIELSKSIPSNMKCDNLFKDVDQKPYDLPYEPAKKYGSHSLDINKTKPSLSDTENHQFAKSSHSNKSLSDNESSKATLHVDMDIDKYTCNSRQNTKRPASLKFSHGSILFNEPRSYKDQLVDHQHIEPLSNACNHSNDDKRKYRSEKTQKNIKTGKMLRVPRSVLLFKRLKLKEALINLASKATINGSGQDILVPRSVQCDNIEKVINDETTQHTEDKHDTTSTATDAVGRHETSRFGLPEQDVYGGENPSWSILKKNCLMISPYTQKQSSSMPPLLLEVKDTLREISMQDSVTCRTRRTGPSSGVMITGHGNRALLQLQTEVNKLWQSSMAQPSAESERKPVNGIGKSKLDLELKYFKVASSQTCNMTISVEKAVDCTDIAFSENRKNTCDTLKVKFLGLRRVSDHTVLVKWIAPQDVTGVQGYELLVDGRAVQKILSPTRCMAVVTCLPHIEKVLITIRTLVSTVKQRFHYPSATIVYRTRAK